MSRDLWRVGWIGTSTYILDGDRAICTCAEPDAARIVEAVNRMAEFKRIHDMERAQVDRFERQIRDMTDPSQIRYCDCPPDCFDYLAIVQAIHDKQQEISDLQRQAAEHMQTKHRSGPGSEELRT